MTGLPGGIPSFLLVSMAAFIVLGSVLEGIPAIVLFGPLLFPIAKQVGVHEVHYAMVIILAMGIGLFAPPFGVGYYAACAISRVHPDAGLKPIARLHDRARGRPVAGGFRALDIDRISTLNTGGREKPDLRQGDRSNRALKPVTARATMTGSSERPSVLTKTSIR